MTIVVTTRRALRAMRNKRKSRGEEEGWIQEAERCLDDCREIPHQLESRLKIFASKCLGWR